MPSSSALQIDPLVIAALEALPDGFAICEANGQPILLNEVARQRFGTFYNALATGSSYREAVLASLIVNQPGLSESQREAAATSLVEMYEKGHSYESRTEDGHVVRITYRPMPDGRKVAISVDVTELREREKELRKARKAAEAASASKSSFLANMSHEIRTPLNGVMGMAQVLESTSLDAQQREYLSTIIESGKTLMALLNDVLDLSKIEAGKFDIVPVDINLHHLLRRQLKLWKPKAEEKGLELRLAFDADLPAYLCIDAVRVQQCVSNLVSNAIKFTHEGRVEIFASSKEADNGAHIVDVRVIDTGPGMGAETLTRLFKPFAQADETIQRAHGGTGLGLSITRHLAELMGGSASATSAPGRGSTFRVSFRGEPARSQPEAGISARPAASDDIHESIKQSGLRVLLVDDHPINRQVASLFLRPYNMHIVEAVNGVEALAALKRETFDLALLDMHMPVMDGPTAVGIIRASSEAWASIPIIALTADAMSGDRERYLAMGVNGYLSKPLAERDLLAEIARVRSAGAISRAA